MFGILSNLRDRAKIMKYTPGQEQGRARTFFQGPEYRGCKIKGTNGVISWNSINNEIKFYNNRTKKWEIIMKLKNFEKNQMYVDEIKHFLKCVKNRRKTINNLDDGINTMNIAIAIKKSGRYKKTIKTD